MLKQPDNQKLSTGFASSKTRMRVAAVHEGMRIKSNHVYVISPNTVASSVAGTRFRGMKEVVTLKTLGATRARIASILRVEFLALGAVAGVMGSLPPRPSPHWC